MSNSTLVAVTPPPTNQTRIAALNHRYNAADKLGRQSSRDKLLVFVGGWLFLNSIGGRDSEEAQTLYAYAGINNKVPVEAHAAQLVLGVVVQKINNKDARKDARNVVDRLAKLFRALDAASETNDLIARMSEEKLADFVEKAQGINGMVDKYLTRDTKSAAADDEEADLSEFSLALDVATAIELPENVALSSTGPIAGVLEVRDGKLHIVPLPTMSAAELARIAPHLPAPDDNLPDDVRLWSRVGMACAMFERQDSGERARPSEEAHDASPMLPSLPIVLAGDGAMSIAASRVDAGMVVTVRPSSHGTRGSISALDGHHLNGTETRRLVEATSAPRTRAMYESVAIAEAKVTLKSRDVRVKDASVKWRPMTAFGSSKHSRQWTNRVASFEPKAAVTLENGDEGFAPKLLAFARKAGGAQHDVEVSIKKGVLTVKQGKDANPVEVPATGEEAGNATVTVSRLDLARAAEFAAAVRASVAELRIDPRGLVELRLAAPEAEYALFMPTLLAGGARNPKLLATVER